VTRASRFWPAFSIAALAACAGSTAVPASSPSSLLGQSLPDFRRPTLRGDPFDTRSARGRVVLVGFFADDCRTCGETMRVIEALRKEHPELEVLGVSLDAQAGTALDQAARYALSFELVHDPGHGLAGRFHVLELPASFVTDRRGRVRWVGGPDQRNLDLRRAAEALLNE
jgi:peroxiredoxin